MGNITRQDRINLHKNRSGISAGEGTLENLVEGIPQFRTEIDHKTGREKTVQYIKSGLDVVKSEFKNVDDTGSTIPVITNYPAFRATATQNQSLATGAWRTITFDSLVHDNGSNFVLSTEKFITPVNGIYFFTAQVLYEDGSSANMDDGERLDIRIYNDTDSDVMGQTVYHAKLDFPASRFLSVHCVAQNSLTVGTKVRVDVYNTTGSTIYTYNGGQEHHSFFAGHLVCAI